MSTTDELGVGAANIQLLPPVKPNEVVESAEDVDYQAKAPKRLTGAMLEQVARDDAERGFDFKLHHTSLLLGEPVVARVKIVNLIDKTLLVGLQSDVRQLVQKLFFSGGTAQGKKGNAVSEMDKTATRLRETAFAYGCAGFISPKLVLKKEDARPADDILWAGSIELHDLQEFVRICEGEDTLAERRLQRFPE